MRVVDPLYPTKVDPVELHRALELLAEGVFEIRIPKAGRHRTIRGYFNDREAAAQAAAKWSGSVPAVYITLNPVNPALLARAADLLPHAGAATWLAPGIAADIPFARPDASLAELADRNGDMAAAAQAWRNAAQG
jgi:hypothetical protein